MKFSDLEPQWIRMGDAPNALRRCSREEAQGVLFLCPVCFVANHGPVGTHGIMCWEPNVPIEGWTPGPGRWHLHGQTFEELTLVGVHSSSVWLTDAPCKAHFFVQNGQIVGA